MDRSLAVSVHIRKVSSDGDSYEFFKKLLPLMDVGFVHNKQLTVLPFPFKYLREYVRGLGFLM